MAHLGFRVERSGFRVWVKGLGLNVYKDFWFRVHGLGFRLTQTPHSWQLREWCETCLHIIAKPKVRSPTPHILNLKPHP